MPTLSFKYRLYPTKEQKAAIELNLAAYRFVYNYFLSARQDTKNNYTSMYFVDTAKNLTRLKQTTEYAWLKRADSAALQQSLRALERAYALFFSRKALLPKVKKKNGYTASYITTGQNVVVEGSFVRLPKVGFVKFIRSREFSGKIKNVIISHTASDKYFVSFCVDVETSSSSENNEIGLTLGLDNYYMDSKGRCPEKLDSAVIEELYGKLKKARHVLFRKKYGSSNYSKQRIKVARIYEKIANIRRDYLNKLTTSLVKENKLIVVESFNIYSVMDKYPEHADVLKLFNYPEFYRMLDYKSRLHDIKFIRINVSTSSNIFTSSKIAAEKMLCAVKSI